MSLLQKATIITTPTAHSNGVLHSIKGGSVADFDVVRGSAATRVNAEGLIEDVATNIPRIDYTTGEGVVLLEPQSTNLFPYSEDFSVSDWSKNRVTINSNQNISPNNKLNASKMIETAVSGNHQITKKAHSVNGSFTNSVFAKKGENNYLILGIWDGSSETIAWFDLENGLIGTVQGTSTQTIEKFGDYYRCSVTFDISASGGYELIGMSNTDGLRNYNGDGTSGVYIWGAQLEALSYPTSYIPTSGAIATRLADSVTGAGDATTFNSTEGVLYAEMAALKGLSATANRTISLSDSTNGNQIRFYFPINVENQIKIRVDVGGSTIYVSDYNIATSETPIKLAFRYSPNGMDVYGNGALVSSSLLFPNFTNNLNRLQFKRGDAQSGEDFYGKAKALAVFNEALTDSELECLTKI